MTNYEWLLQMGGEERQAWFDAQHVDANDTLSAENYVSAADVDANDADVAHDSREKMEAEYAEPRMVNMKRYFKPFIKAAQREIDVENDSREKLEDDVVHECAQPGFGPEFGEIMVWLDRQAAITRREVLTQPDERDEQIAELAAQVDRLTDELEITRGKNKAYKVHISKMQEGRNGWHIKAEHLQKQVDKLTAERDELKAQVSMITDECEQYRELLGQAITKAAEIVNLQP